MEDLCLLALEVLRCLDVILQLLKHLLVHQNNQILVDLSAELHIQLWLNGRRSISHNQISNFTLLEWIMMKKRVLNFSREISWFIKRNYEIFFICLHVGTFLNALRIREQCRLLLFCWWTVQALCSRDEAIFQCRWCILW